MEPSDASECAPLGSSHATGAPGATCTESAEAPRGATGWLSDQRYCVAGNRLQPKHRSPRESGRPSRLPAEA